MKNIQKLTDAKLNTQLTIQSIEGEQRVVNRLNALGLMKGGKIEVIEKQKSVLAVKVFDARYAINSDIASKIFVYQTQNSLLIDENQI